MLVTCDQELLDVALLFGGSSSERSVSLQSGAAVAAALTVAGHNVARFDPAEVDLLAINWRQFDACFIALHGGAGEDGRLQAQLDELGVPYTGSGPAASRTAMSKLATKECLLRHGVLTPPAVALSATDPVLEVARRLRPLRFPLVIKPDGQGCSLGVSIVRCFDELPECISRAAHYESNLLAERWIQGRELTVALVGREILPALEIIHQRELFDFDAKFHSDLTLVQSVSQHDPARAIAEQAALDAAAAIGTRGLVRVDVIVDDELKPWVLELNTVPGMSDRSLAPRAAALAGMEMPQFCHRLLCECLVAAELVV